MELTRRSGSTEVEQHEADAARREWHGGGFVLGQVVMEYEKRWGLVSASSNNCHYDDKKLYLLLRTNNHLLARWV